MKTQMRSNPYQSPVASDLPSPAKCSTNRPDYFHVGMFGLFTGAWGTATATTPAIGMLGLISALVNGSGIVETTVGCLVAGCIAGGLLGAAAAAPLALLARTARGSPGKWFSYLARGAMGLVGLICSLAFAYCLVDLQGPFHATVMLVSAAHGLGLMSGVVAGIWCDRNIRRYVWPSD